MFDTVIAPSGTLLGLLQRGRGDGTLHALTAPRPEALAALNACVLSDPRHDWQVENRSLYYARLYVDLHGALDEIEQHLFCVEDALDDAESRTGLALAVLGHLASYGRADALALLRRYASSGANWTWALDELALRDEDAALRDLAGPVLARFPRTAQGEADLAAAVRDAFEPRPWRLWADDPRPEISGRVRAASERGSFDQWQRQLSSTGPRPGWSVQAVFDWAEEAVERGPGRHVPAARCLAAVAGDEDRPEIRAAARSGRDGARATALRYLAAVRDREVLGLIEEAVAAGRPGVVHDAAVDAFERMPGDEAVQRARVWVHREDGLGAAAGRVLACRGGAPDHALVLAALRRAVRDDGADSPALWQLVDGAGRLGVAAAAPVLRHVYRETASSHLRGRAARALAATDPSFAAGFAVECLWDCEESTREVAARHAETGDTRVVEQLRRLAADPAEEDEVQTAVRSRIGPEATA
ncbi:HEAT repeat domain-containing protein [Streptomyces triticagri]|uniref:HEAT repeat domain-containing protein n=1 Tax=Streptomyces triticagri TaxID=2293568 RepID=A0A372M109_9ACTN|nr:HEAT repeat domain-containing protein [Streptomyces triticagri]RFU84183.1 HEAT repeat domain-containing protein [Streptomyces triticagri]